MNQPKPEKHPPTKIANMSSLPSRTKSLKILRQAGCDESVLSHSLLVAKIAKEIAYSINHRHKVDLHLVEIGALLHDIGRSKTHGITHGAEGAEILGRFGYPEQLVRLVRNHVGAGIPREEASAIGLPPNDYTPATIEEKVVCYADKLVSGNTRISFEEALNAFAEDLGWEHPGIARFRGLHREIMQMAGGTVSEADSVGEDSAGKRSKVHI